MKALFVTTAFAVLTAGSAIAADVAARPYTKAPVLAPAYNWTGLYIGGGVGYGSYLVDQSAYLLSGLPDGNVGNTGGGKGWFGTVIAGYDLQFADRFVVGIFADYDFSDIKGKNLSFSGSTVHPRGPDAAWSVGGRLGFLVSPATLLYATGGYTHGDFRGGRGEFIINPQVLARTEAETSQAGTFIGAGVETMLWHNLSGRLEYRYAEYDAVRNARFSFNAPEGFTATKPAVQTIRASLAYKFGTPGIGATYSAPVTPAFSWTGFYLGGGIGYGTYAMDAHYALSKPFTNGGKGVLGTVVGGYDVQFANRWVAGIFADYDFTSASGAAAMFSDPLDQFFAGDLKQKSAWAVGGRIGYLVTPQTLAYATGGYTQAEFDTINFARANIALAPNTPIVPGQTFDGWFAGAGMETQVSSNWFARLEYRYAEYDSKHLLFPIPPTAVSGIGDLSPTVQTVRAGITYKFGRGPVIATY